MCLECVKDSDRDMAYEQGFCWSWCGSSNQRLRLRPRLQDDAEFEGVGEGVSGAELELLHLLDASSCSAPTMCALVLHRARLSQVQAQSTQRDED